MCVCVCAGKTAADYNPLLSLHGRSVLLANGSIWMEAVGPQDEGHYLCRATNGIGSGLGKVIYVSVNGMLDSYKCVLTFALRVRDATTTTTTTIKSQEIVLSCH